MEVVVLASGSSGNAALVVSGDAAVLVDAGISARSLTRRLAAVGWSPDRLAAVLVTHEHSDHCRGLEVLLKRYPLPVWATRGTWGRLPVRSLKGGELRSGQPLRLGGLSVLPVATSHDAAEPVAVVVGDGSHRAAVCTDTGILTRLLADRLADCDLLCLESNHDADLLVHGPYPWPLKQRIRSSTGHLANHQAVEALAELINPRLRAVVGMHLSEQNNVPDLVDCGFRAAAGPAVEIAVASRHRLVKVALANGAAAVETFAAPDAPAVLTGRCSL